MDNYQCEGYGLIALNNMLEQRGHSRKDRAQFFGEFSGELGFLFDTISPEEAEDKAKGLGRIFQEGR